MKVMVTGGSGFIGSHVVDKLIDAGHQVRLFDTAPSPYRSPEEVDYHAGDVTDLEALHGAARGCEAIVHLAAVADVNHVIADPATAQVVNAEGTLKVLEAARQAGVRRVVYGSTIWAYSDCPERQVDEDTRVEPPSHLYTATKLAGEHYCKSYAELYDLEYTVLRFGIPYGPRARDATVLAAFCAKAESGERLTVAGDGSQSRRFVYVEDLAEGVVSGLRAEAANRIYNLTGDEDTTILQIAEAVRDHVADSGIVHTPGRKGDLGSKEVSSERAERELGWRARTRFAEGFRSYLAWRRARPERRKVLILTADIGEGHDLPARALARELEAEHPGSEVEIVDGLRAMGRFVTSVVRDGSWFSFNWLPVLFSIQYFLLSRLAPTRWLALRIGYRLGARGLLRVVKQYDPDVIVSTYPGTTMILGELRLRRRLDVPVVAAITDLAGLRFWAHPGIDLHTVTHRESIEEVEALAGPGSARWAQPPTAPEFLAPREKAAAKRSFDLADGSPAIVVSGGGWGVGDLVGAVETSLAVPDAIVLVLSGHNEHAWRRLREKFGADERVRLLGFTERMSDLLAAADALVHSTAGLTVLEAQIRGCPTISYGFAVGHIRANNRAYERFGLARVATSKGELAAALREALAADTQPDESFGALPSPATLAIEARPRVKPLPAARLRATRFATVGATASVLAAFALVTDYTYPLFARALGVRTMSSIATTQPDVGVLVDARAGRAASIARSLSAQGIHASFALDRTPNQRTLRILVANGDEPMPRIDSGGVFHSFGTGGRLAQAASSLGLARPFYYEPPPDGKTTLQALLAKSAGGHPVGGAVKANGDGTPVPLHPGEFVAVDLTGNDTAAALNSLRAGLGAAGLRGVSLSSLAQP